MADIIVSENGTLVAEDIWHGFDEGAREAIKKIWKKMVQRCMT